MTRDEAIKLMRAGKICLDKNKCKYRFVTRDNTIEMSLPSEEIWVDAATSIFMSFYDEGWTVAKQKVKNTYWIVVDKSYESLDCFLYRTEWEAKTKSRVMGFVYPIEIEVEE